LEDWNKVIDTYERIYSMVPKSRTGALALWNAARVAYNEIDDSMAAQAYIDRLRKEFGTADSSKIITEEPPDLNIEALQ
jgi:outer membrane protein assembly factor BamD (BamD/ComL family)